MSAPVLVGFTGVLVAAVATGMLAGRCARRPRADFIVWTAATLGLTIALAAQSMGFQSGFGPVTFRAIQLFALTLAPLWLAWGLVELAVANEAARFGMRLVSGALTVVAAVILATDPLTAQPFSKAWPLTREHFQPISYYVLGVVQAAAVLAVAAAAVAVSAARARDGRRRPPPVAVVVPVGLAVLITAGLRFPLPAGAAYPLLSMLAAALVWFGASRVREAPGRAARRNGRREAVGDGRGRYRSGDRPDDDYRPGAGYRPADGQVPEGQYAVYGERAGRPGSRPQPRTPDRPDRYRGSGPGGPDDRRPGPQAVRPPGTEAVAQAGSDAALRQAGPAVAAGAGGSPGAVPARPYGRLQIFTLLDDRVAEFDRLAEQAAEEVRTGEPDTLVYVIHLVPNAPLQRIFYEIYRDRAAFDSHESQPYVQRFVAERRACVLATNVIELRLKYAKVAPLPSPQNPQNPQRPQGTQRLQPLPPARPARPDQQRPDQQRPDQQRPDQQRPDQQRPDQRWPDQRQVPSAGRRY